ncbi:hypothetical protein BC6307_17880 [Sutcliffiella cohnii]|uniref:Uncharacterized protein n=1 Tax=Sutcliffiella cohnii TaxID=33932 RepID=A0A223KUG5_9BACI|nr:hypothetical protein [Sutcliffiella cohnii]AST92997.1 hypothetical protein BC6307_17880 [Sutcliffiella cohnii]
MIKFKIVSVNTTLSETDEVSSVRVHYNGSDETRSINISGNMVLSPEEYVGNDAIPSLKSIIKNKVIEQLQSTK